MMTLKFSHIKQMSRHTTQMSQHLSLKAMLFTVKNSQSVCTRECTHNVQKDDDEQVDEGGGDSGDQAGVLVHQVDGEGGDLTGVGTHYPVGNQLESRQHGHAVGDHAHH